jgi:dynein heavy chain 1
VRLWAHEAMRLFQDRLVLDHEKEWCDKLIDQVALKNFPSLNSNSLERPILFTNYLTKNYVSVDKNELKRYIEARLKIFYE